jgi:hypothetical protein
VFPEPTKVGDTVMIPATSIDRYGAVGQSRGRTLGDGRPVAVIEAGASGVVVKPVLDLPKIGLALVAAGIAIWRATK